MGKPNFNQPGQESLSINGKEYHLEVYQDVTTAGYSAVVKRDNGTILTHCLLSFGAASDAWAWCFGSLDNIVRGMHR